MEYKKEIKRLEEENLKLKEEIAATKLTSLKSTPTVPFHEYDAMISFYKMSIDYWASQASMRTGEVSTLVSYNRGATVKIKELQDELTEKKETISKFMKKFEEMQNKAKTAVFAQKATYDEAMKAYVDRINELKERIAVLQRRK